MILQVNSLHSHPKIAIRRMHQNLTNKTSTQYRCQLSIHIAQLQSLPDSGCKTPRLCVMKALAGEVFWKDTHKERVWCACQHEGFGMYTQIYIGLQITSSILIMFLYTSTYPISYHCKYIYANIPFTFLSDISMKQSDRKLSCIESKDSFE